MDNFNHVYKYVFLLLVEERDYSTCDSLAVAKAKVGLLAAGLFGMD